MHKLDGKAIRPSQDPGEYLTEMVQERDELEYTNEILTEARILDLIQKGLIDKYELIQLAAKRGPEILLEGLDITIGNMYVNRVARGDGSTFLRGKGRLSAMMAPSGFKGS